VDSDYLAFGHGEQTERIIFSQVVLCGKGQFRKVLDGLNIPWFQAELLHFLAIEENIMVDALYGRVKPGALEMMHFIPAHAFLCFIPYHFFASLLDL
jgi:hypothetical protein